MQTVQKTLKTSIVLKALADDIRLTMVRCLAKNSQPVRSCDIVSSCSSIAELSQPAMSHHFKKLTDAGVITVTKIGTENVYQLNRQALQAIGIDVTKI